MFLTLPMFLIIGKYFIRCYSTKQGCSVNRIRQQYGFSGILYKNCRLKERTSLWLINTQKVRFQSTMLTV
ncbi:hypothetical protein A4R26_31720 [Niastella populi]|uniref:Uncharacterized protein n=1 Tax=Niastella populi TaxID=550983 RepID=A0A1V9EPG9_9BACT|nr:hypothetical protein A4R26_31720 [Niastella populi]